jgi:hypothetical protein
MYALREEIYVAKHASGDHVALEAAFVTPLLRLYSFVILKPFLPSQ